MSLFTQSFRFLLFFCVALMLLKKTIGSDTDNACNAIISLYASFDQTVPNCAYASDSHTYYYEARAEGGLMLTWAAASLACKTYSAHANLAAVRDTSTLAFLQKTFPKEQLANHWINFRISQDEGSNVFNALENHGWQWEDGTPFGTINNWYDGTSCDALPCCLGIFTPDGKFDFDDCGGPKFALCEYTPVTNDLDCSKLPNGDYADPLQPCSQYYYTCTNGIRYTRLCPSNLYFDGDLHVCNYYSQIVACQ